MTITALTRVSVAAALGVLIAASLGDAAARPLRSLLLGVAAIAFVAGSAMAARREEGAFRPVYAGLAAAGFFSFVAHVVRIVLYQVLGAQPTFPPVGLQLLVFGAHPCLAIGFAAGIRWRRRRVEVALLLDALLLVAAAVIVGIMFVYAASHTPVVSTVTGRAFVLVLQVLPFVDLLLLALLLASRGPELRVREALGLGMGTVALAAATVQQGSVAATSSVAALFSTDALWALTAIGFAAALPGAGVEAPADGPIPARTDAEAAPISAVRARFVVAAVVVAALAALLLGFGEQERRELAVAIAVFGVLLALRVGHVLARQREEAGTLAHTVGALRDVSQSLEQRVAERTERLAEAERVLRRMFTLGQQVTTELQPGRVLDRFVEAVVDVALADAGSVALVEKDGNLRIVAAAGNVASLVGMTVPIEGSALGRAVRTGRPWSTGNWPAALEETGAAPLRNVLEGADVPRMGSVLVVPLERRGEVIGAVGVGATAYDAFTADTLARVESMTDMLTVALANAELVETLRQTEWRFRTLFRAAPDAVLTVLAGGRVREANDAVRELTGTDPMNVVGSMLIDLVVPDDRSRVEQALATAAAGSPVRLEVRFDRAGTTRVASLALARLPEAEPPSVLVVARDETHERDMRARLVETERLAAVGELVAGVAHEVNNPLGSISAFAQLMLRDPALPPAMRESVEVIKGEAMRASQVVKDLLAFARRSEPQRAPLDLNHVLDRTLRLRGYELDGSRITVETDLEPSLPPVLGDARQLQQVALNLVTNAIQAMGPRGGGTLRVRTRAAGEFVVAELSDTGPGIPAELRARIFEPFFTTKEEGEGTGLGLSVSYGIVAAHGGSLRVSDSGPGGTTFCLSLPAALDAPVAGDRHGPPEQIRAGARSPLAGLRVLFVDDEPALRRSMEAFARLRGFSVVTAPEGRSALDVVRTSAVDAIVCDLRMPGMDGVTFLDLLRLEQPSLAARTLFVTGDVAAAEGRFAAAAARQATLAKPFAFERLEEALAELVRTVARSSTAG